jgi:hypothetical protein
LDVEETGVSLPGLSRRDAKLFAEVGVIYGEAVKLQDVTQGIVELTSWDVGGDPRHYEVRRGEVHGRAEAEQGAGHCGGHGEIHGRSRRVGAGFLDVEDGGDGSVLRNGGEVI